MIQLLIRRGMDIVKRAKRFILLLAAVTLFWVMLVPVAFSASPVTLMAVTSSSSLFPYVVSIARVLSTFCPEYLFVVNESGGNMDNTTRIRSGETRLAHSVSFTDYENYFGTGPFRHRPFQDFRILWYYQRSLVQIVAARDSSIKTLHDLNGRPFSGGGGGKSASTLVHEIFDVLDIHPDYLESNSTEASQAYISGYVDGIVKLGPTPDTYLEYLNALRPVRFLSLSLEDMARVLKTVPGGRISFLPTNVYDGVDYEVRCLVVYHGIQSDMSFTQEEGYRFFKAMWEDGRDIWQKAYPVGKGNNVPKITLEAAMTPLHAGTVQYLVEHGYDVPEELIPPEYVPVR